MTRPPTGRSSVDAADLELDAVFKRLNLANARRVWRDLVARAEREEWSYDRFLAVLVAEEIAHRQQTRLTRLSRRASFPSSKRSTTSISPTSRPCASPCSARRSPRTSSPRAAR